MPKASFATDYKLDQMAVVFCFEDLWHGPTIGALVTCQHSSSQKHLEFFCIV